MHLKPNKELTEIKSLLQLHQQNDHFLIHYHDNKEHNEHYISLCEEGQFYVIQVTKNGKDFLGYKNSVDLVLPNKTFALTRSIMPGIAQKMILFIEKVFSKETPKIELSEEISTLMKYIKLTIELARTTVNQINGKTSVGFSVHNEILQGKSQLTIIADTTT